jgi:uncharacterized protein YgbK (DUF1537 family)
VRRVLILADDLTGALEAGARFAGAVVVMGTEAPVGADVVVFDTETRHLSEEEAAAVVRDVVARYPAQVIYKKTDSTLRGNIGAELSGLPEGTVHYVPAYPRMGRLVRDGVLLVEGVPVHETAFAMDPCEPVTDSRVRSVLREPERVVVYDGETEEDVRAAARMALQERGVVLVAGPAAVGGALAGELGLAPQVEAWPRVPRCRIVNGSMHPASAAQVQMANERGLPALGWAEGPPDKSCRAMIVFGGDTARRLLRGFNNPLLYPVGEPLPGVVLSRFGNCRVLISKAGGFGAPDLLLRLHELLCDTEGAL